MSVGPLSCNAGLLSLHLIALRKYHHCIVDQCRASWCSSLIVKPYRMLGVQRCSLLLQMLQCLCLCVCVCQSQPWAVLKWLSKIKMPFGVWTCVDLGMPEEPFIRWELGPPSPCREGAIWGHLCAILRQLVLIWDAPVVMHRQACWWWMASFYGVLS